MDFKSFASRKCLWVVPIILFASCSEAPLITSQGEYRLNSPSSMVLIPGTDLAVVANANVNLDQTSGALFAVDLGSDELLLSTFFLIPNFAGDIFLDTTRTRIYIPNHDNALLVYEYSVPGTDGNPISFSAVDVPTPVDNDGDIISNGVETDNDPTQALMISGTSLGDLILTVNQTGSVSMIPANTLELEDMDSEEKYFGLRLFSSFNFVNADQFPGRGASRMGIDPTTGLIYITSSINNQIYILDPSDQTIEAMINLDSVALPTVGIRSIVIDSSGIAYVAHSGLDSVLILDISGITKNGIPYEVILPPLIDILPVGDGPEDLKLNALETTLYVCNQNEDSVYMIDTGSRQITVKTYLDLGKSPGRLILDEPNNRLYSLDFISNTISIFNATTGSFTGEIE